MSEPRLAAKVWVTALLRRVHAAGDFATVLRRGDDIAGSIALIVRDRLGGERAVVRGLGPSGDVVWQVAMAGESVDEWIARQSRYDPDLWVVELDTPDPARFVEETIL